MQKCGEIRTSPSVVYPHLSRLPFTVYYCLMSVPLDLKNPASFQPRKPSRRMTIALSALLLLALAATGYFYLKYRAVEAGLTMEETDETLRAVGAHIMLPEGVTPRIGKVANADEFKNDPFLKQAAVGDVVLFYPHEGRTVKAILWRPSVGKVVDVALVTLPAPESGKQ